MLAAKPQLSGSSTTLTLDGLGDTMTVTLPDVTTGSIVVQSGAQIRATGAVRAASSPSLKRPAPRRGGSRAGRATRSSR